MKRILNKKVNKEAKEQFGNVIERCTNKQFNFSLRWEEMKGWSI